MKLSEIKEGGVFKSDGKSGIVVCKQLHGSTVQWMGRNYPYGRIEYYWSINCDWEVEYVGQGNFVAGIRMDDGTYVES